MHFFWNWRCAVQVRMPCRHDQIGTSIYTNPLPQHFEDGEGVAMQWLSTRRKGRSPSTKCSWQRTWIALMKILCFYATWAPTFCVAFLFALKQVPLLLLWGLRDPWITVAKVRNGAAVFNFNLSVLPFYRFCCKTFSLSLKRQMKQDTQNRVFNSYWGVRYIWHELISAGKNRDRKSVV